MRAGIACSFLQQSPTLHSYAAALIEFQQLAFECSAMQKVSRITAPLGTLTDYIRENLEAFYDRFTVKVLLSVYNTHFQNTNLVWMLDLNVGSLIDILNRNEF